MPETPIADRTVLDLGSSGIPEVPMLGRYNFAHAHEGLVEHAHPGAMEICYLAKGTQIYRVGRRDFVLRGGDVFVTFPGEEHSTGEAPQEKGVLYWIHFLLPRKAVRFLNCPPGDARQLVAQLLAMPNRHFAGDPLLQTLLDEIMAAAGRKKDPLRRVFLGVKLVEFLLKVLECSRRSPKAGLSIGTNSLLRHIDAQVEEPLAVPDLAARMALSVSRFKARFKQEIGIPPAEYVLRRKISEAKKLLARPGTTVTDVAFRLSFSSSQYFATVFKRYTGKNPGAFLAHHQTAAGVS
ncbi:MAG: AraC family transcriptional regulator [Verrucomicrobiaceae bacterium]|nr:MAG: AraC family transcriptional regulator [Verrucomicrobiaceae bacterium]